MGTNAAGGRLSETIYSSGPTHVRSRGSEFTFPISPDIVLPTRKNQQTEQISGIQKHYSRKCTLSNQKARSSKSRTLNIGAEIITISILEIPCYNYSIMYPKTLFQLLRPLHYLRGPHLRLWFESPLQQGAMRVGRG